MYDQKLGLELPGQFHEDELLAKKVEVARVLHKKDASGWVYIPRTDVREIRVGSIDEENYLNTITFTSDDVAKGAIKAVSSRSLVKFGQDQDKSHKLGWYQNWANVIYNKALVRPSSLDLIDPHNSALFMREELEGFTPYDYLLGERNKGRQIAEYTAGKIALEYIDFVEAIEKS